MSVSVVIKRVCFALMVTTRCANSEKVARYLFCTNVLRGFPQEKVESLDSFTGEWWGDFVSCVRKITCLFVYLIGRLPKRDSVYPFWDFV